MRPLLQPPASVWLQVEYTTQGHHTRVPAWQLPPNRAALSRRWVSAAALTYL